MKIKVLLFALLACGFMTVNAQSPTFEKGDKVINLGIGFGGNRYNIYTSGVTKTPFLSASLDVGVLDGILDKGSVGIGGFAAYKGYSYESGYGYGFKETNIIVGARGTFHYPLIDKLDTYVGLLVGFNINTWKETGNWYGVDYSSGDGGFYSSGFIGGRYYFTDRFAVVMELGSGYLSLANIGIAIKL